MTNTQEITIKLMMPSAEAMQKLDNLSTEWKAVKDLRIDNESSLERAKKMCIKWSDYQRALMRRVFENKEIADEFSGPDFDLELPGSTLYDKLTSLDSQVDRKLEGIEAIMDQLKSKADSTTFSLPPSALVLDPPAISRESSHLKSEKSTSGVFISRGYNDPAGEQVARFIEVLGLKPTMLDNMSGDNSTVTEINGGFGVVLLTPADEGRKKGGPDLRDRVGQNVLLELGYLMGRLGKNNVCALYKGSLEMPTDHLGVLLLPFDDSDDYWQLKLAKKLKTTGFPVDMNKAV